VGVDAARLLARRIEQQQHWRQAEAVRSGDQPANDPDADSLVDVAEGLRLYARHVGLRKRLVDGRWLTESAD
jgi:hypothetical protein